MIARIALLILGGLGLMYLGYTIMADHCAERLFQPFDAPVGGIQKPVTFRPVPINTATTSCLVILEVGSNASHRFARVYTGNYPQQGDMISAVCEVITRE
jgi:hypothetical protein